MAEVIDGEAQRVPDDPDAVEVQKVLGGTAGLDDLDAAAGLGGEDEQPPRIPTRDQIRGLVYKGFSTIAPAWNVSEQESADFSDPLGDVIDIWFPDTGLPGLLDKWGPYLSLVGGAWCLFAPRVGMPLRHPPKPEAAPEKTDG